MQLTIEQVNELLRIIDRNQVIALGNELGPDFLTPDDLKLLGNYRVEFPHDSINDTVFTSFHFGMLAEALGVAEANKLSYNDIKEYIGKGKYIPLTERERATVAAVKNQKFTDLRSLRGRIFRDVNQVLTDQSLKGQREYIREQIAQGVLDRKSVSEISNSIAEKTGDWSRDFDRIVAYTSTLAFENGKAAMIERNNPGVDPIVYKTPLEGACKNCVKNYLTNGEGSVPKLFKLSVLRANGTNIGLKVADWVPTLGPQHPFCRCPLFYLPFGYQWDSKKGIFRAPLKKEYKPNRPKIKVWISGQEKFV